MKDCGGIVFKLDAMTDLFDYCHLSLLNQVVRLLILCFLRFNIVLSCASGAFFTEEKVLVEEGGWPRVKSGCSVCKCMNNKSGSGCVAFPGSHVNND